MVKGLKTVDIPNKNAIRSMVCKTLIPRFESGCCLSI